MVRIAFGEGGRQARLLGGTPFEFIGVEHSVVVFNVVHLLLLLRTPEVALAIEYVAGVVFHALGNEVVLPKGTGVAA